MEPQPNANYFIDLTADKGELVPGSAEALEALASQALDTSGSRSPSPTPTPSLAPAPPTLPAPTTPATISRGRGSSLNDTEILTLMRICSEHSNILRTQSKTAFFQLVSASFEIQLDRSYVSGSCRRMVEKLAAQRRAYLNQHQTGRADGTTHTELDELIDEYIMISEEVEEERRGRKRTAIAQQIDSQQDQVQRQMLMTGLSTPRTGEASTPQSLSETSLSHQSEASIRGAQRRAEERDEQLVAAVTQISNALLAQPSNSNEAQLSMRIQRVEEDLKKLTESINEMPNLVLDRLESWLRTRGN